MLDHYDVIIVGAGLAGLTAAYELGRRNQRVLVLEAAEQPGGKIITRRWQDRVYECGALFALRQDALPLPIEAGDLYSEDYPIGVFSNSRLVAGDSVMSCLEPLGLGLREILVLDHFFDSASPQPGLIGDEVYAALDAFFRVIHPGALSDYVPARRRDGLACHNVAHYANGNQPVITGLVAHTAADIRTGCRVTQVRPENSGVSVHWLAHTAEHRASADWVVLATPAPDAKRLTAGLTNVATSFLAQVRYGKGIVVILGLRATALQPFAYIVLPASPVNTLVFHHHTQVPGEMIVTAYVVAEQAAGYWDARDDELAELVRAQINALNIGLVAPENVMFSDVYRWRAVGPIITAETYAGFSNACLQPAERMVLAGDYTWWDKHQMPYGTHAAIASGKRAAEMICAETSRVSVTRFQPAPLAQTLVTLLTDQGPQMAGCVEDGAIAYYGLLLQAEPNIELERYLLGEAEDGLWSYHQGYGVTSLDSALVMEGLLATGRHVSLLNYSAERLVAEFFNRDQGGLSTIPHTRSGRALYWRGTDCPATGYGAWLLAQIAPARYADTINQCADYLGRKQNISGSWPGKWFPSETIPIFYAVRLLASQGAVYEPSCRRARIWLWGQQRRDGSWLGSVIESAAAILALCILGDSTDVIRRGAAWIQSRHSGVGWAGEPILQYWFEDGDKKTLYHASDYGKITTAWATLALRQAERSLKM